MELVKQIKCYDLVHTALNALVIALDGDSQFWMIQPVLDLSEMTHIEVSCSTLMFIWPRFLLMQSGSTVFHSVTSRGGTKRLSKVKYLMIWFPTFKLVLNVGT